MWPTFFSHQTPRSEVRLRSLPAREPPLFLAPVICRIVVLFMLGAACVAAQPKPAASVPQIDADAVNVSAETGEAELKGNAQFRDGLLLVTAHEIRYNRKTEVITASGNVIFTRADLRLLADRLVYNRPTGGFEAESIRLGSHPYFIEGFSAFGTRDEITVKRARASYGEPGPWQPTINADTISFSPGQELRSENVTIGIGHTQPVPIPRFNHRFSTPLIGAAALTGGFRSSLGVFIDATLLVPVRPSLRLGADVGLFSSRGVMVGPSGRYSRAGDAESMRGYFRSGYIDDHGSKGTEILGRPIGEDRGYVEWQHRQHFSPRSSLSAQLNWWSDSEVVRDFRPRAFFPVQEPDTFVEAVHTGANYILSAFTRFQPNSFQRVQERLPEIRFDLLPYALGNGFYHRFSSSAAVLREDPLLMGDTLRSDRLDAYYSLVRPITPREWLTLTPMVGGRLTHYVNATVGGAPVGNYLRLLGEIGADVALRASGTFEYKNPQWKIDGLRHLLTPRLGYRYIPQADKGRAFIPRIDRQAFSTYLQPLGLGDVRHIDDLRATNTLRLSLDNVVQTRDPVEGSRDLLFVNIANDFRFRRLPGERNMSEVHAEIVLLPARWLLIDAYHSTSPHDFRLREFNSGITIKDGRVWSLRFGNNFLRNEIQDYTIDGRVRLNERFEALSRLHYDARRRRFNEQAYGIVQNLGNTWLVSYTVSLYSGRRRESSFGFNIQIDTVRF